MENNNDFKYVIQDTGHLYFGKELTYQEIMDREDVPFKFKAIVSTYVVKDTPLDVKITEHVLKVSRDAFSYRIFEQLKMDLKSQDVGCPYRLVDYDGMSQNYLLIAPDGNVYVPDDLKDVKVGHILEDDLKQYFC